MSKLRQVFNKNGTSYLNPKLFVTKHIFGNSSDGLILQLIFSIYICSVIFQKGAISSMQASRKCYTDLIYLGVKSPSTKHMSVYWLQFQIKKHSKMRNFRIRNQNN